MLNEFKKFVYFSLCVYIRPHFLKVSPQKKSYQQYFIQYLENSHIKPLPYD